MFAIVFDLHVDKKWYIFWNPEKEYACNILPTFSFKFLCFFSLHISSLFATDGLFGVPQSLQNIGLS